MRGANEVCHQRGEAIVVAKADLFVGYGVVFVHHGHDVERRERFDGSPGVQVLAAM